MRKVSNAKPINMSAMDHKWFDTLGAVKMAKAAIAAPKAIKPKGSKPVAKAVTRGGKGC